MRPEWKVAIMEKAKRRGRRVMTLDDFTDTDIAALEATRAPQSSKSLDDATPAPGPSGSR